MEGEEYEPPNYDEKFYPSNCRICDTEIYVDHDELMGEYEYCSAHDPSDEPNFDELVSFEHNLWKATC